MKIFLLTQDDDKAVVVAADSDRAKGLAGFRNTAECVTLGLPEHAVGRVILKSSDEARWFYHANDTLVVARSLREAQALSGYTDPKRLCSSNLEVGVL